MAPVRNLQDNRPNIVIPSESNALAKIIITADDGTDYVVMDTFTGGEFILGNELAWYRLDGNLLDSSGNRYDGTITGSPTYATGKYDRGLSQADSASDGFSVPALGNNFSNGISVCMWLKTPFTDTSRQRIWSSDGLTTAFFQPSSGNLTFYIWNGSYGIDTIVTNYILGDNAWHHYVVTIIGTTTIFYRDGSLFNTYIDDKSLLANMTNPFYFAQSITGTESVTGVLDDCRIYNSVLSLDDITNMFNHDNDADDRNYCLSAEVTKAVTDKLGSFSIKLANDGGQFLNYFNGGEVVRVYSDFIDATTLIFRGKIDNVNYGLNLSDGFFIDITGRDYPEIIDRTITGEESSATADISLSRILYNYFNNITLVFWNGSAWAEATFDQSLNAGEGGTTWNTGVGDFPGYESPQNPDNLINISYQHKKAWNVITDICTRVGIDCYLYYDEYTSRWLLRTFLVNAITNTNGISYGTNLTGLDEFGTDTTEIINRAIVYGKTESDNILLLKTEDDTTSQSNLWIKDNVFNESSLVSMSEVEDKAASEIVKGVITTPNGRVECICTPNFNPGELTYIIIPYCGVNTLYKIQSITHKFDDFPTTSLVISKKIPSLATLFIPKINSDELTSSATGLTNPNDMKDSYTIYFDESPSIVTHVSNLTEEVDGKLQLKLGETTGTMITNYLSIDYNATKCELRKYDALGSGNNDIYYVTNNGGVTWELYDIGVDTGHTFSVAGNSLGVKIVLNRSATMDSGTYESIALLYK